jgi:hypothetical protein
VFARPESAGARRFGSRDRSTARAGRDGLRPPASAASAAVPPLASLGGVTAVVMAVTTLGSALAAGLAYLAVLPTRAPERRLGRRWIRPERSSRSERRH